MRRGRARHDPRVSRAHRAARRAARGLRHFARRQHGRQSRARRPHLRPRRAGLPQGHDRQARRTGAPDDRLLGVPPLHRRRRLRPASRPHQRPAVGPAVGHLRSVRSVVHGRRARLRARPRLHEVGTPRGHARRAAAAIARQRVRRRFRRPGQPDARASRPGGARPLARLRRRRARARAGGLAAPAACRPGADGHPAVGADLDAAALSRAARNPARDHLVEPVPVARDAAAVRVLLAALPR